MNNIYHVFCHNYCLWSPIYQEGSKINNHSSDMILFSRSCDSLIIRRDFSPYSFVLTAVGGVGCVKWSCEIV